jgi:hypothetical protein
VPPVKKASPRSSAAAKQPAALKQLATSLDGAQTALGKLRTDLGRDVSAGSKTLYKDLEKFVKDAVRHSGRLSKALERDLADAQKKLAAARPAARKTTTARPAARKSAAAAKPAARKTAAAAKPAARKTAAAKPAARKPAARRSAAK